MQAKETPKSSIPSPSPEKAPRQYQEMEFNSDQFGQESDEEDSVQHMIMSQGNQPQEAPPRTLKDRNQMIKSDYQRLLEQQIRMQMHTPNQMKTSEFGTISNNNISHNNMSNNMGSKMSGTSRERMYEDLFRKVMSQKDKIQPHRLSQDQNHINNIYREGLIEMQDKLDHEY